MPNLASVLKDEICRLARREARAEMRVLKSVSAQYRRDIAALKRKVKEQEREIAWLRKAAAKGPAVGTNLCYKPTYPEATSNEQWFGPR